MKDKNFSISIVTADESVARLFMEKIRSFFQKMTLDIGMFGEAKPALLYIERHLPSVIIVSDQIPGMKWQEFSKAVEKYSPHSLILRLTTKFEGIKQVEGSHIVEVGVPILEWDKVMLLIEDEIPTEVKFRFGMARRENVLLKKLREHALSYEVSAQKKSTTFSLLPQDFDSKESLEKDHIQVQEKQSFEKDETSLKSEFTYSATRKEEWSILLVSLILAITFHLPWAEKGNWELLRWFFNFLVALSILGFLLKPFSLKDKKE